MTLRGLVADLVSIDSVNPDLVPGGAGELEIARFIGAWLEGAGVEVRIDEIVPGRANVIGRARGRGGGRTLLLNGHTDTVGHNGYERPLEPRREGDRLYGRGSFDMKGGTAAALWACARAVELELAGDVVVAAVCDEEFASIGTRAIADEISADAAIVTEPTALAVCIAHKGFAWLEVEVTGRAAHGSQVQLGIDAIAKSGRVLTGIEDLGQELASGAGHPLLGTGSLHASLIAGGQELSSYPERCLVQLERRTVPGEGAELVEQQVRGVVARAARADPALRAEVRATLVRPPYEISQNAEIVRRVRAQAERALGAAPALIGWAAWMDSAILDQAGIPTVVFGPGGAGAHETLEWVDLASVERCAEVLIAVAGEFCA
ncbi:MAG: acetylornithine deacetylase [Gaiellales bacterium]|nr:acetylornithine deacetylase [Gaiellales bacterium]